MLRNNLRDKKQSKSKRQSGFFTTSDLIPNSFTKVDSTHYSNQTSSLRHEIPKRNPLRIDTQTIIEEQSYSYHKNTFSDRNKMNTIRENSERSLSSNLSFLSENSSVLDLIYQDLEDSFTESIDSPSTPSKSELKISPMDTKALFIIDDNTNEKGEWKLLNDDEFITVDDYSNPQIQRHERTELNFS